MFGPDVRTLSATGHPAVDTPALKRALDQLSYPSAAEPYDWRTGTLLLHHGDCPEGFRIDAPLSINSYDTCTQLSPPRVIGLGHVRIRYAGAETDAPVLSVFGRPAGGRAVAPLLENLFFNCARRCRGPLLHNQVYRPLARDCLCYASREIGWDLVDCWGGSLQNVHAISVDGIALRAHRFNSGRIDGLRASNLDAAQWPGEHDTSVLDAAGNPVQTSPEQRALLVIQGNDNQITQTILENCRGAMPLLHYRGFVARFAGIRLEDNDLGGPTFVVDGRARRDGPIANCSATATPSSGWKVAATAT